MYGLNTMAKKETRKAINFDLDTMKTTNETIIETKLLPTYVVLEGILNTLQTALIEKDYLNDADDISRIIRRFKSVTDEDINEVIKLADLIKIILTILKIKRYRKNHGEKPWFLLFSLKRNN